MSFVFQDWKVNTTKGKLILLLFRLANLGTLNKFYFYLGIPYRLFYTLSVEWILGVEIQWRTKIGKNLQLHHGQGLVVHGGAIIGNDCSLRHNTTIGNKQLQNGKYSNSPIIGNNVDIGSNVCVIGQISIGDNVKIGSGSVVVKDVSGNCTAVGNPAREIKKDQIDEKKY